MERVILSEQPPCPGSQGVVTTLTLYRLTPTAGDPWYTYVTPEYLPTFLSVAASYGYGLEIICGPVDVTSINTFSPGNVVKSKWGPEIGVITAIQGNDWYMVRWDSGKEYGVQAKDLEFVSDTQSGTGIVIPPVNNVPAPTSPVTKSPDDLFPLAFGDVPVAFVSCFFPATRFIMPMRRVRAHFPAVLQSLWVHFELRVLHLLGR